MNELIVWIAMMLFNPDEAVIPLRPAPLVTPMGTVQTLEESAPAPEVLYAARWGG